MGGSASREVEFASVIQQISSTDVDDASPVWPMLFASRPTFFDIFHTFDVLDVRRVRYSHPHRLANLLFHCISTLHQFTEKHFVAPWTTPTDGAAKSPPVPASESAITAEAAMMILTRLMPIAMEPFEAALFAHVTQQAPAPGSMGEADNGTLRRPPLSPPLLSTFCANFSAHFFHYSRRCRDNSEPSTSEARFNLPTYEAGRQPCINIAHMLSVALLKAAFIPGFTIGARQCAAISKAPPPHHPLIFPNLLWIPGVGSDPACSIHFDEYVLRNRLTLIKCFISCLMGQIMAPQGQALEYEPIRHALLNIVEDNSAAAGGGCKSISLAPTLVASLVNTAAAYQPYGLLPYTSHWTANMEEVVMRSGQLLGVLMDTAPFYQTVAAGSTATGDGRDGNRPVAGRQTPPSQLGGHDEDDDLTLSPNRTVVAGSGDDAITHPSETAEADGMIEGTANVVSSAEDVTVSARSSIARSSAPAARPPAPLPEMRCAPGGVFRQLSETDADYIRDGLQRLISVRTYSKSTYLPGSQRTLRCVEEIAILVWKFVDRCPAFRLSLMRSPSACRSLVLPLLDIAFEACNKVSQGSSVQMVVILLMKLSCERDFCLAMNEPFPYGTCTYAIQAFEGTYFDLIAITLHSLLLNRNSWVAEVHHSMLATLVNMSSFATMICSVTATKLVNLLIAYSNPSWLCPSKPPASLALALGGASGGTENTAGSASSSTTASAAAATATQPPSSPLVDIAALSLLQSKRAVMLQNLILSLATMLQYHYPGSSAVLYALTRQAEAIRRLWKDINTRTIVLPDAVQRNLQLFTIVCAINFVEPECQKLLSKDPNANVMLYLTSTTLVGKLPVPHAIMIQRFPPKYQADVWLTAWLWSCVYVHSYPIVVDVNAVTLFGRVVG